MYVVAFRRILNLNLIIAQVGTQNRYGRRYKGHYDIWILNEITMLFRKMPMSEPSSRAIPSQWINGRDFLQTTEKCAITQLSTTMKNDLEIRDYDENYIL